MTRCLCTEIDIEKCVQDSIKIFCSTPKSATFREHAGIPKSTVPRKAVYSYYTQDYHETPKTELVSFLLNFFLVQFSSAIHVVITVRWRKLCTGLLLYKRVRSIIVFEMMKSMRRHYRGLEERTTEEMGLQTFAKSSQWRRRRDLLRQSVPQPLGIKRWPENLGRRWLRGGCVSVSVKDHATIKCVSCFCFIAVDYFTGLWTRFFAPKAEMIKQLKIEKKMILKCNAVQ